MICDNGVDQTNDADTLADYRLSGGDLGCVSVTDGSEVDGQCDDTFENDGAGGDGFIDYPSDPECNNFADLEYDCTDTDGGQVYTCVDVVTLKEFYCFYKSANVTVSCAGNMTTQCSNGARV